MAHKSESVAFTGERHDLPTKEPRERIGKFPLIYLTQTIQANS